MAGAFWSGWGQGQGETYSSLYIVWAELLLTSDLRACAQRLLASGDRDGSLSFFLRPWP